jgi:hypothetical protein
MEATAWIKEGDWVSGTSSLDEKFIGFVESMNQAGALKVWVTQCDREDAVGSTLEAKLAKVKKLPDSSPETPDELRDLIELSLITHDQEWFAELSEKLYTITQSSTSVGQTTGHSMISVSAKTKNRLIQ